MSIDNLTLVSHHLCPYVQRAAISLAEKDVAFERKDVDLSDKPDWFRRLSPLGKVPLLQVDGETLFESAVILEYLEETQPQPLHPAEPLQRARHRAWIEFASATLDNIAGFYNAKDAAAFAQQRSRLIDKFHWLEQHLHEGPYFARETFSLVDAAFGPLFRYFDSFEQIADFGFFATAPRVSTYRQALTKRPSVQQAVAEDYPERLMTFLQERGSHLSGLIQAIAA